MLSTISRLPYRSRYLYELSSKYYLNFLSKERRTSYTKSSNYSRHFVTTSLSLASQDKNSLDRQKSSIDTPQVGAQVMGSAVWTIPNVLCGIRIAAAPFLGYCVTNHFYIPAIGILFVAGLTDLADGYIARTFRGQSSKLGTFLDPLADKILIITLYSSMVYANLVPMLLMAIIVLRDVLLLSAGMYIRYLAIPPPRTVQKYFDGSSSHAELRPTYLSKVNTVLQISIAIVSLYAPTTPLISHDILSFLWYATGFSTVISGLSYVFSKKTFVIPKNSKKGSR